MPDRKRNARQRKLTAVLSCVGAVLVVKGLALLSARSAPAAGGLGADGRLRPAPASPNGVCSEDPKPSRRVPPFVYPGPATEARERLLQLLRATSHLTIVDQQENYVYAVAATPVFGFRDDLEFRFDDAAGVIHCRSVSRLGYSDLGANRRRLARLLAAWR